MPKIGLITESCIWQYRSAMRMAVVVGVIRVAGILRGGCIITARSMLVMIRVTIRTVGVKYVKDDRTGICVVDVVSLSRSPEALQW